MLRGRGRALPVCSRQLPALPGHRCPSAPRIRRLRRGCTQPEEEYGTSLRSGSIFDSQEEVPAQAGLGGAAAVTAPIGIILRTNAVQYKKSLFILEQKLGLFFPLQEQRSGVGDGQVFKGRCDGGKSHLQMLETPVVVATKTPH